MEKQRVVVKSLLYLKQIINLVRNPRDVCLSFLNHLRLMKNYIGDLETIADIFIRDLGPYYAPYFKHILSYWEQRKKNPNLLIIFYEDMKKDVCSVIRRIAKFLEIDVTEEVVNKLAEHTSVKSMKQNPMCNYEAQLQVSLNAITGLPHVLYFLYLLKKVSFCIFPYFYSFFYTSCNSENLYLNFLL